MARSWSELRERARRGLAVLLAVALIALAVAPDAWADPGDAPMSSAEAAGAPAMADADDCGMPKEACQSHAAGRLSGEPCHAAGGCLALALLPAWIDQAPPPGGRAAVSVAARDAPSAPSDAPLRPPIDD